MMEKILIPRIKFPMLVAPDIVGVQPMTGGPEGPSFRTKISITSGEDIPRNGAVRHVFSRGWEISYHGTWVSMETWWKIKIAGF